MSRFTGLRFREDKGKLYDFFEFIGWGNAGVDVMIKKLNAFHLLNVLVIHLQEIEQICVEMNMNLAVAVHLLGRFIYFHSALQKNSFFWPFMKQNGVPSIEI